MTMTSDVGRSAGRRGIKDTAAQAVETARELAGTGRDRTMDAARMTVAQARRNPVSTGLLVAGAVVGGAMLLNPALRRVAIAAGPAVWKMLRSRQAAA